MIITALVENTSAEGLPVEHGLSLWVEACGCRFLFDLGQGGLFASNARRLGAPIEEADFAVVSHGHYDHGGGIDTFLSLNEKAKVYLHRNALTPCFSLKDGGCGYIGLNIRTAEAVSRERIVFTDGITELAPGLTLFSGGKGKAFFSPANRRILKRVGERMLPDDFLHEQSLIIEEGENTVLLAGCAHSGIVNIKARAEEILRRPVTHVVSGMHLTGVQDTDFINGLAHELLASPCRYYTCHCTGEDAYRRMKTVMGDRIEYLSCGMQMTIVNAV